MDNDMFQKITSSMYSIPGNSNEALSYYKGALQSKVDQTFWQASDIETIGKEINNGSLEFDNIKCRVVHAIQPKTGLNLGDDFKELIFSSLDYPTQMGDRYLFADSVWIVTNTDNTKYITKSAIIRRCNNVLKWIDSNGNIVEEPAIIDYSIKYGNIYYNSVDPLIQGTIKVICQHNNNSSRLKFNDRFILGSIVYKVKNISDFLRNKTYESNSVTMSEFQCYVDVKFDTDDFVNGIASRDEYNPNSSTTTNTGYEVVISPITDRLISGQSETYNCVLFNNGVLQSNVFSFTPSGVPNDYYILDVIDGNNFKITCTGSYFSSPLKITCTSGSNAKEITIALRGLY